MKKVSTLKSSSTNDSPKTPGGISRSALSPCPRLGLSRNYRKSGAMAFRSPLSTKTDVKQDQVEIRKRKISLEETPQTPENEDCHASKDQNVQTPTRKVELPLRKKSKTLLASIYNSSDENGPPQENICVTENTNSDPSKRMETDGTNNELSKGMTSEGKGSDIMDNMSKKVITPLSSKSRSTKNISSSNAISKPSITDFEKENLAISGIEPNKNQLTNEKSPSNLTKECIVVIQKKIFKKELKEKQVSPKTKEKLKACSSKVSQAVFDSDSDDVPLIHINKDTEKPKVPNTIDEDDPDFATSKTKISKPVKTKSKLKQKSPATTMKSNSKVNIQIVPDSQTSEDDDFFEKKKTILIRKNYEKVIKPQKAKSTGSITQKDIDDLKARIETKKKMLLAKAMTEDTKQLTDLIKKWKRGCQDALMELMDLMKSKFPDKQNMDYSEILKTLKIPSSLVGYDSDNDCFLTPDDENIILAKV